VKIILELMIPVTELYVVLHLSSFKSGCIYSYWQVTSDDDSVIPTPGSHASLSASGVPFVEWSSCEIIATWWPSSLPKKEDELFEFVQTLMIAVSKFDL